MKQRQPNWTPVVIDIYKVKKVKRTYVSRLAWQTVVRKRDAERLIKEEHAKGQRHKLAQCGTQEAKYGLERPVYAYRKRNKDLADGNKYGRFMLSTGVMARAVITYTAFEAPKETVEDYA